jgi:hypothetical protein
MSPKLSWYQVYDNVVGLASYLVMEKGWSARELLWYLEKPWKWTGEWEEYEGKHGQKPPPASRAAFAKEGGEDRKESP